MHEQCEFHGRYFIGTCLNYFLYALFLECAYSLLLSTEVMYLLLVCKYPSHFYRMLHMFRPHVLNLDLGHVYFCRQKRHE